MSEEQIASNVALVERFYAAFDRRDHGAMAASYTPTARFSDPVFRDLTGPRIATMWRMLCERATDLRVECGPVRAAGDVARVEWQAWYIYSGTGRRVHNRIATSLELEQGLIRRHDDVFDLYRWARQALGIKGLVLGWTPLAQRAIRRQAIRSLEAFASFSEESR
jgi:limonene-1,2-epoxide hydrolase